jgi:RecB family exonuclease
VREDELVPIALVTGPANAGKAHVVLDAVRAHVAHGEEPLLVVPTETDQARYRRELAEGGLALGVRVERFESLLAVLVARAELGEARIGSLTRERMLARLADARPGTAGALARLVAELETQRVTPARLRGALGALLAADSGAGGARSSDERTTVEHLGGQRRTIEHSGGGRTAAAGSSEERTTLERVCEAYERYHEALVQIKRADRELHVTRALDALRRKPALWGATPVVLYGFDDLTELQLDAIETLGGVVGARVTVSLAYEPGRVVFAGRAATFQRLAPLADAHTELGPRAEYYAPASREALHHLERSLLSDDASRVDPGEAVRLLEGGSPRAELELVAGEVRAALDGGVRAEEIAIVHRAPEEIAGLLGEVLEDFDIPHTLRERVSFAHTAIGRALIGLLRCAEGEGQLGDLLAWLRAPGMLERPELADRLEASARRRGLADAERARALWEAEHWQLDRIDRVREAAGAGMPALADTLIGELERLFCAPRRSEAAVLGADELGEARALAAGRRGLEQLRELARAAPALAPSSEDLIDVFGRLELGGAKRSGGGADGAGTVLVVSPLSLRARRVRMVFLCGLIEGVFPTPARPHPLLGEEERRRLAHVSGLVLRGEPDTLAAERYLLYALTSRPEERLTLSWHTADEDGRPLAPSLFLDDVCDLFSPGLREGILRRAAGAAPGECVVPAGHVTGSSEQDVPPGMPSMPQATPGGGSAGARPRPIRPPREERVLAELRSRVLWSASSLESWAGCPVRWFVERLLRGEDIEPDPEPLARGALAHAVLKQTLECLRERTGSARVTPASVALAKRLLSEALIEQEQVHPLSRSPERVPGARRRLATELERYLESVAESPSPLEPTYLELEFGFEREMGEGRVEPGVESSVESSVEPGVESSTEPGVEPGTESSVEPGSEPGARLGTEPAEWLPPLELGDGVLLRGRIDRVDLGPSGEAVVYDYKARAAPPSAKWVGDGQWQVALYMRAVERLLGHVAVGGFYQPLAGRDIRPRGALSGDGGVELDVVRTDRVEGDTLQRLLDECVAAARAAAGEARSGALEPRPDTCAYGGGCAYPTICRCER